MTSTKTTAPAAETSEDSATRVGPMHEAFAAYLNENFQAGITPRQIFLVTSQRKAFRATPEYRVGVKAAQADAKAQAAQAREKGKAERAAQRAAAKAEKEAAAAEATPAEKPAPAAKPAAKKAAPKTKAATPTKTA